MTLVELNGQDCKYDEVNKTISINIKEPFYSAGKKFGWQGNTLGLGINVDIINFAVNYNLVIVITVGKNIKEYYINGKDFKEFCDKHSSYYITQNTRLGVIQWEYINQRNLRGIK